MIEVSITDPDKSDVVPGFFIKILPDTAYSTIMSSIRASAGPE